MTLRQHRNAAGLVRRWTGAFAAAALALAGCSAGSATDVPTPGDPTRGEAVYQEKCAACHGITARGADGGPPLVHDLFLPDRYSDSSFSSAVRNGARTDHWDYGPMPSIRGVSDQDVADIIAHVRDLQRAAGLLEG